MENNNEEFAVALNKKNGKKIKMKFHDGTKDNHVQYMRQVQNMQQIDTKQAEKEVSKIVNQVKNATECAKKRDNSNFLGMI